MDVEWYLCWLAQNTNVVDIAGLKHLTMSQIQNLYCRKADNDHRPVEKGTQYSGSGGSGTYRDAIKLWLVGRGEPKERLEQMTDAVLANIQAGREALAGLEDNLAPLAPKALPAGARPARK